MVKPQKSAITRKDWSDRLAIAWKYYLLLDKITASEPLRISVFQKIHKVQRICEEREILVRWYRIPRITRNLRQKKIASPGKWFAPSSERFRPGLEIPSEMKFRVAMKQFTPKFSNLDMNVFEVGWGLQNQNRQNKTSLDSESSGNDDSLNAGDDAGISRKKRTTKQSCKWWYRWWKKSG